MPTVVVRQFGVKGSAQKIVPLNGTDHLACVTPISSTRKLDRWSVLFNTQLFFLFSGFAGGRFDHCSITDLRILSFQGVDDAHLHDHFSFLDLSFELFQDHSSLPTRRGNDLSQYGDVSSCRKNGGGSNEYPGVGRFGRFVVGAACWRRRRGHFKGAHLRSEIVPANQNVHSPDQCLAILDDGACSDASFGQQDHSRTGSPGWLFLHFDKVSQGLPDVLSVLFLCRCSDQSHRGRFSSWKDHSIESFAICCHIGNGSDLFRPTTGCFQACLMLFKGTLDG
mmetsp:Transcript_25370/g.69915  ORF Transcript_25370/g.69915 Transcript_25370/m.69915 type:complete len:280 (-) Transcript_25370:159-998(-)